jgi:hypothetical protein
MNSQAILYVLLADVIWLLWFSAVIGAIMAPCAIVVGFVAAAITEFTHWLDLPSGMLRAWIASSGLGVALGLVFFGASFVLWQLLRSYDVLGVMSVLGFMYLAASFVACLWLQGHIAVRYFHRKIIQLNGWKTDADSPLPANRRYSYSLRNMLLGQVILMFALGAWIGMRRQSIEMQYRWQQRMVHQRDVVARFGPYGWQALVTSDGLIMSCHPTLLNFHDSVLDQIRLTEDLETIDLPSDQLTDDGLARIARHPRLHRIAIKSNQVTDAGIAHLKQLPALRDVTLSCDEISDEALAHLQAIPTLRSVRIQVPRISKAAADQFRQARPDVQLLVIHRLEDY